MTAWGGIRRAAGSLATARAVICATAAVDLLATFLTAVIPEFSSAVPGVLICTAWWLSPLGYYWFRVRTVVGAWLLGIAYIAASAFISLVLVALADTDAGLVALVALLFAPVAFWAGMLVGVDIDRFLAKWALLRRQRHQSDDLGLDAVEVLSGGSTSSAFIPWWQWTLPTGAVFVLIGLRWKHLPLFLVGIIWSVAGAALAAMTNRRARGAPGRPTWTGVPDGQ